MLMLLSTDCLMLSPYNCELKQAVISALNRTLYYA